MAPDAAGGADLTGHAERIVEQASGHDRRGAGRFGLAQRDPHLARDLGLADDHRLEAGRDPAKVTNGVDAVPLAGGSPDGCRR